MIFESLLANPASEIIPILSQFSQSTGVAGQEQGIRRAAVFPKMFSRDGRFEASHTRQATAGSFVFFKNFYSVYV